MKQDFGIVDGKPVYLFTMKNKNGITIKITNYGGIITSILGTRQKREFRGYRPGL